MTVLYCCSVTQSCPTLCDPMDCSTPGFLSSTTSWSLLRLMSIESVMPSNISSSVAPFSSCLQSSPALGSFPMSWLFVSGGQSIGASTAVLPELPTCRYTRFYCGAQIPPVLLKGVGVGEVIQVAWRGDGKSHSDQKCSGDI